VAVRARAMQLLDLPAELLVAIAAQLAEDEDLAFALACRRLRQAVAGTERHAAGAGFRRGSARRFPRRASWSGPWCRACYPSAAGCCSARRGPGSSSS
jgi:hypothetical protein